MQPYFVRAFDPKNKTKFCFHTKRLDVLLRAMRNLITSKFKAKIIVQNCLF